MHSCSIDVLRVILFIAFMCSESFWWGSILHHIVSRSACFHKAAYIKSPVNNVGTSRKMDWWAGAIGAENGEEQEQRNVTYILYAQTQNEQNARYTCWPYIKSTPFSLCTFALHLRSLIDRAFHHQPRLYSTKHQSDCLLEDGRK